jgi:O-antigen/teichoic acid export membrane protein
MTVETQSQSPDILPAEAPRKTRFTSSSLLARNAALNLATNGWIVLVLIVAMPKLVHYLGETSFGLFSLAWVMIGYLTFLDVGVNRAATKFISEHLAEEDHESARKILRTGIYANFAMGMAGGLAVALLSPYLIHSVFKVSGDMAGQARWAFYAVSLAVPVLLVQGIFRAALSSFQRFGWINAVDALATGAQWTVAGILAWKGYGVALVVFSTVVARILATGVYGFVVFRLFPDLQLLRGESLHGLPRLLRFGSWVTVSQLVGPLLVYLDRVLIASYLSLGDVTLYTVPFEAATRLRVIPLSLAGTLYPAFSERGVEEHLGSLQRLYEASLQYLLILVLPAVLFLLVLGPDLLALWMGAQFAKQASAVLQILALGVLFTCISSVPYNALQALGRPDVTGKFHLLELPLYWVLLVLLIPRWGIAGAALANSARIAVDAVLLFWAVQRYCRCYVKPLCARILPKILGLNVLLTLCLMAARFAAVVPWVRLGAGGFAIGLYFLSVWVCLVRDTDRARVGDVLRLLTGRGS